MRRIWRILTVVLLVASCGTDNTEPDALALVSDDALAPLDDVERVLVDLEATWMCDAQRTSSTSDDVVDESRARAIAEAGLSDAEYDAFRAELADRADLREAVLARFIEVCDSP